MKLQKLYLVLIGVLIITFIIELFISWYALEQTAHNHVTQELTESIQRIQEDIQYSNGKWDMHRYNADPDVPESSPLYIVSTDGFIVDRWKPVHGYLDISDIKHLLTYQTPQTI